VSWLITAVFSSSDPTVDCTASGGAEWCRSRGDEGRRCNGWVTIRSRPADRGGEKEAGTAACTCRDGKRDQHRPRVAEDRSPMISTTALPFNKVRVTFSLDHAHPAGATSVVGCFNDWTPGRHTLRRRSNGSRSASVVLPRGRSVSFRYLTEGGVWTDDPVLTVRDERGNSRLTV
jgi:hypothetical protein